MSDIGRTKGKRITKAASAVQSIIYVNLNDCEFNFTANDMKLINLCKTCKIERHTIEL